MLRRFLKNFFVGMAYMILGVGLSLVITAFGWWVGCMLFEAATLQVATLVFIGLTFAQAFVSYAEAKK